MHSLKNGPINIGFADHIPDLFLDQLVLEINEIYLEEEGLIWPKDGSYQRISRDEIRQYIEDKSLIVAQEANGMIIGTVRIYKIEGLWYFGLLTTNRRYRSLGIASMLMQFLESIITRKGEREIYIELLFAQKFKMDNKIGLEKWYINKGFEYVETIPFLDRAPHMRDIIKQPCDFKIMKKSLI